jgi:tRNA pseudouridine synthase 10
MRETEAIEAKFHGGGREDVDARCLGKREFVLELVEPLHRDLDLDQLQEEVNQSDKIDVFGLRPADKDEIEEIKEKHADKTYRAYIKTGKEPEDLNLEKLEDLEGDVEQRTPERVEHRRADKTRHREVLEVDWGVEGSQLVLKITAEAGTYIKELVSSDEGRTQPSVAGLLDTEAQVDLLDVTWIEK